MNLVLVALDFSECSVRVLDEACRLAGAFGAPLLALHVADLPRGLTPQSRIQPPGSDIPRTVAEVIASDAHQHLDPLVERARAKGIDAAALVEVGPIAQKILGVAESRRAGWVVLGTHARTGLSRVMFGSVAEEVVRHAKVPVVTVRSLIHEGCESRSCATCEIARTDVEKALLAEGEG